MQKTNALFTIFLFLYGCNKEPVEIFPPGPQTFGYMKATKKVGGSGANWTGGGSAALDNNDPNYFGMSSYTADEYGQIRDVLSIYHILLNPEQGPFPIQEGGQVAAGFSRRISDGDVAGAYYRVQKNGNNWISIIEMDTLTNRVKGRFEVHFEVSPNYADRGFPEKVSFLDGYFEMNLKEYIY